MIIQRENKNNQAHDLNYTLEQEKILNERWNISFWEKRLKDDRRNKTN